MVKEKANSFYDGIENIISPFHPDGWLQLVTLSQQELALLPLLPDRLHIGEAACLCIARQRGWGILTDDRAARKQAQSWGLTVSGTLGVLVAAIQDGTITVHKANELLHGMIDRAYYHSPVTDINQLLNMKR